MIKTPAIDKPNEKSSAPNDSFIVSEIYSSFIGLHGELGGAVQYLYNYLYFKNSFDDISSRLFIDMAKLKSQNFYLLGKILSDLFYKHQDKGNRPRFKVYVFRSAKKAILDGLARETLCLEKYQKIRKGLKNERMVLGIEKVISNERAQISMLEQRLKGI